MSISSDGMVGVAAAFGNVAAFRPVTGLPVVGNEIEEGSESGDVSVAVSGDGSRMVVGSPGVGRVRVWFRDVSGSDEEPWVPSGNELSGQASGEDFGASVAISSDGTTIAVGASGSVGGTGRVTMYRFSARMSQWTSIGFVEGSGSGDTFGTSISLSGSSGSIVAVGAPQRELSSGRGYVQVYDVDSLTPLGDRIEGEGVGDRFGISVSISEDGSTVAAGGWGNDSNGENSGHVRVFNWTGSAWTQLGDTMVGDETGDVFGYCVSLSGNGSLLAVGAPQSLTESEDGYVRVFSLSSGSWTQVSGVDIKGESGQQLGFSVSLAKDASYLVWGTGVFLTSDGRSSVRWGSASISLS
jgi:hypothetical protein